ncbi:MAG: response regulator, partial [Candidatus Heritagella sp.]
MSTSFPIQVIVADDEYYARKALVKILQEADPDIRILAEMESGQAVMDYLKNGATAAHIVVTDIRMPGADGL